jgi:hypothetical protein
MKRRFYFKVSLSAKLARITCNKCQPTLVSEGWVYMHAEHLEIPVAIFIAL